MRVRQLRVAAALVAVAALVAIPSALADDAAPTSVAAETTSLWFVELSSPPSIEGTSAATLAAEKKAFRDAAKKAGVAFTERYAFDRLWNGLSISVNPANVSTLARIPGVAAMYPVATVEAPESTAISPELETALAMTGADNAQSELGYTGAGIKVAVMDTGVDYDHADLGGDGTTRTDSAVFPTGRVVAGYDFVGDAFNANPASPTYNPVAVPDARPDDCNGHGTHVAGIVGASGDFASGGARGVAPGVQFGAYRVFGCEGSTTADIMIAAMERALADDMDILNMSIGSAFNTWHQYPTAAASDRLVNAGMVVVASIGNSGANGVYSAGAPGVGEKVIGVASFDNTFVDQNFFTVTPAGLTIGYGNAAAAPPAPTTGSYTLVKLGNPGQLVSQGCSAGDYPTSVAGKAVLVQRGSCTFHTKALHAMNKGAAAVVLYNHVPGAFSPTVAGVPAITIPVVAITDTNGIAISNAINTAGSQTLNWQSGTAVLPNPTGGLISSFSSYGLAAELALKPDIGGPGGLIRSSYPLEKGGYATVSGTSMSSPHVAGAAALLLQAKPNTPAAAVRAILQNTATPRPWWASPAFVEPVHRQGAGMVQIDKAILATTKVEPGKLSLGESEAGPQTRTLTIENNGSSDVTYALSHTGALGTHGSTYAPGFNAAFASVAFAATTVTVPAGGTASVDVTITAPASPVGGQYGGYIVLAGGGETIRVPYAGYIGDYQARTILNPTAFAFPWLAKLSGSSLFKQSDGAVYTMTGGDIPYLLVHFGHQTRKLRVDVVEAASGKAWHRAIQTAYIPRNQSTSPGAGGLDNFFFSFSWDGVTTSGGKSYTVPNGTYKLVVRVQKALGDDENPAHWETWTSPAFTIARP